MSDLSSWLQRLTLSTNISLSAVFSRIGLVVAQVAHLWDAKQKREQRYHLSTGLHDNTQGKILLFYLKCNNSVKLIKHK